MKLFITVFSLIISFNTFAKNETKGSGALGFTGEQNIAADTQGSGAQG